MYIHIYIYIYILACFRKRRKIFNISICKSCFLRVFVRGEYSLKISDPQLLRFWIDSVWKTLNKRITQSVNEIVIDKGVHRTAPATLGLLNIGLVVPSEVFWTICQQQWPIGGFQKIFEWVVRPSRVFGSISSFRRQFPMPKTHKKQLFQIEMLQKCCFGKMLIYIDKI